MRGIISDCASVAEIRFTFLEIRIIMETKPLHDKPARLRKQSGVSAKPRGQNDQRLLQPEVSGVPLRKKAVIIVVAVIVLALAVVAAVVLTRGDEAGEMKQYVLDHQTELESYVENLYEEIPEDNYQTIIENEYNGWRVELYPNENNAVMFIVSAKGFAPGSRYKGFAFSPNDVPIGFQATAEGFVQNEDGSWQSDYKGNDHYCERITDRWYYFEIVT